MRKTLVAGIVAIAALAMPAAPASAAPSCHFNDPGYHYIDLTGTFLVTRFWDAPSRVVCDGTGETYIAVGLWSPTGTSNTNRNQCTGWACTTSSGVVVTTHPFYCLQSLAVGWQQRGSEVGGYTFRAEQTGCFDIPGFGIRVAQECSKSLDACLAVLQGQG
jgi:hypothetical protein